MTPRWDPITPSDTPFCWWLACLRYEAKNDKGRSYYYAPGQKTVWKRPTEAVPGAVAVKARAPRLTELDDVVLVLQVLA